MLIEMCVVTNISSLRYLHVTVIEEYLLVDHLIMTIIIAILETNLKDAVDQDMSKLHNYW